MRNSLFLALILASTIACAEDVARASCTEYDNFPPKVRTYGDHDVIVTNLTTTPQNVHVEFKDCVDVFPCGVRTIDKTLAPGERWFSGIYQVYTSFRYRNPNVLIHRTYSTVSGYVNLHSEGQCHVRILKY